MEVKADPSMERSEGHLAEEAMVADVAAGGKAVNVDIDLGAVALSWIGSGLRGGALAVAKIGVVEVSAPETDAHADNIMRAIKEKKAFFMLHSPV